MHILTDIYVSLYSINSRVSEDPDDLISDITALISEHCYNNYILKLGKNFKEKFSLDSYYTINEDFYLNTDVNDDREIKIILYRKVDAWYSSYYIESSIFHVNRIVDMVSSVKTLEYVKLS